MQHSTMQYRTSMDDATDWQSVCWPMSWTAAWVGALTAIAVGLVIGLAGIAVGAYPVGPEARIADWRSYHVIALVWSVAGAFFAFVAGGWVAAKMRGERRPETAILHGAVAWVITIPLMLVFASLGAASFF